jgi:hypothetical protein
MQSQVQEEKAYPKTASIISLIGGIIILLGGVVFLGAAAYVIPNMNLNNVKVPQGMSAADLPRLISGVLSVMGGFGVVCGGIVLLSATMLLAKVGERRTWGILILVFSVLSFVGLGGFVIGAILGMIGGILALRWKPPTQ